MACRASVPPIASSAQRACERPVSGWPVCNRSIKSPRARPPCPARDRWASSRTERAGWSSAAIRSSSAIPRGRPDAIVPGVGQPVEPARCGSRGVPVVVRPVHKPEAGSVRGHGKGQRMEIGDKPFRDHGGLPRDGESSAGLADLETDDRLPARVASEEVAPIATWQAVLVIANALSPWFAGLAAHEGQGAERRGQELVRISVMAAVDVMRQSAGPALAGVAGAQGEDLARGTQDDRTRVPLARRDHLEPGAVGPDPDHASARKLDAPPVFADSPGNPLI